MTKRKELKKAFLAFGLCMLTVGAGVTSALPKPFTASAATVVMDYDETAIESDLSDVNAQLYPADKDGKAEVIRFQEYCYSEKPFFSEAYGLYVYVYNPTENEVSQSRCTLNMAVEYSDGAPVDYENVGLTLLDYTDNWRFLKFKVTDDTAFLERAQAHASANDGARRYDVSDLTLYYSSGTKAEAANISKTYTWTGYGAGLNDNEESTLVCNTSTLETLSLKVAHTYYRPNVATAETPKVESLHSVYFAVPNSILEEYGSIYEIEAEYLGATLKPMLVTGNESAYNSISNYLGQDMSSYKSALPYMYLAGLSIPVAGTNSSAAFAYNYDYEDHFQMKVGTGYSTTYYYANDVDRLNELYLMFNTDFSEDSADSYVVDTETLKERMKASATKDYCTGVVDGAEGSYASDIFSSVDTEKTPLKVTADDTFDLTIDTVQKSFWEKVFGGSGDVSTETWVENKKAIHEVTALDFVDTVTQNCENLLIAEADYDDFYSAYEEAEANDETLFLYHYRISDYTAYEATLFLHVSDLWWGELDTNAYFFTQSVDLDFDIIDVTCREDGVDTVLSVVSAPVDYVADGTPPTDTDSDKTWTDDISEKVGGWFVDEDGPLGLSKFSWVLIAIGVYLVLCVIGKIAYPLIPFLVAGFAGVFFIVTIPFRFISWLVRKVRGDD